MDILLVEDNLAFADALQMMLAGNDAGFEIRKTASLESAKLGITERKPDVILLDLNLPDSEGLDTFHSIHDAAPNVAIVILTAIKDDELAIQAVRDGAQDYLDKSVAEDTQALAQRILLAAERHGNCEMDRRVAVVATDALTSVADVMTEVACQMKGGE